MLIKAICTDKRNNIQKIIYIINQKKIYELVCYKRVNNFSNLIPLADNFIQIIFFFFKLQTKTFYYHNHDKYNNKIKG